MDDYKNLKIVNYSFGKIILSSLTTTGIGSFITFFKFEELSIEIKVIIILSISLIIAVIDLILLFIREREITYELNYLKKVNNDLTTRLDRLDNQCTQISKNIQSLNKFFIKLNKK